MRGFSGHFPPFQLLFLWDLVLAYDSMEVFKKEFEVLHSGVCIVSLSKWSDLCSNKLTESITFKVYLWRRHPLKKKKVVNWALTIYTVLGIEPSNGWCWRCFG